MRGALARLFYVLALKLDPPDHFLGITSVDYCRGTRDRWFVFIEFPTHEQARDLTSYLLVNRLKEPRNASNRVPTH